MEKDRIQAKINAVRKYWKTLILLEGLEITVLSLLVVLVFGFYVDMIFKLNYLGRHILAAGSLLVLLASVVFYIILPAMKKIDEDTIALTLEEKNPELKSMLISAIQLKRENLPEDLRGSPQMIEALHLETLKHVKDIHYSKVYKRLRLLILALFFIGGAAAAVKYSASYPEAVKTWFLRVLKPGADIAPFSFTKIEVEPKSKAVLRGENVKINVELSGELKDSAGLHIRQEGGEWEALSLKKTGPGKFEYEFIGVVNSFRYFVTAGDGRSNQYDLLAKERPAIIKTVLRYFFPDYTRAAPKSDDMPGGDITALIGTRVQLECTANTALQEGFLEFADGTNIKFRIGGGVELSAGLTVSKDTSFKLKLKSLEGFSNINPPEFLVRALPDNPPVCELSAPADDISVTRIATVTLVYGAADDFEVTKMFLKYKISGSETFTQVPLKMKRSGKSVSGTYEFQLRNLPLEPGKKIEYYLTAVDNNPAPPGVGESLRRNIAIIDKAEVMVKIRQEEQKIRTEIQEVIEIQNAAKSKVDAVKNTAKIGDKEKEAAANSSLDQKDAAAKTGSIADKMKDLIKMRKSNELANTTELESRENMQKEMEDLSGRQMRNTADDLSRVSLERDTKKAKSGLKDVSGKQQEMVKELEKIRDALGKTDIIEELIAEAQKILVGQRSLSQRSRELAKKTLGLAASDLKEADSLVLQELSDGEKKLKENVNSMDSKTLQASKDKDLVQTDPETARGLADIDTQYVPLEKELEKAAGYIMNARFGTASGEQEKVEEDLKKLVNDLEKLRRKHNLQEAQADPDTKALTDLQNALDSARQAADMQADINSKAQKQGELNESDSNAMKELSKQENDVKNLVEDAAQKMEKNQEAKEPAKQMGDLARDLEKAKSRLNQNDAGKDTQGLLQGIQEQLNKTIGDMAKIESKTGGRQEAGKEEGPGPGEKGEQGKEKGQQGGDGKKGSDPNMAGRAGSQKEANMEATSWGDLPAEVQKNMIDTMKDQVPVEYIDMIKGYYRKLSEEGDAK